MNSLDGIRILATIVNLYRSERPLAFFSGIGISLAVVAVGLAIPIFVIGATLQQLPEVARFEARHWARFPWMKDVARQVRDRLDAA